MKIILAVDGSPFSDAAVSEMARRPWPAGSVVRVLYAVEPFGYITPEAGMVAQSYFEEIEEAAREIVRRAVSTLEREAGARLKVEQVIRNGFPKQAILDEAKEWGADLIVLGSQGRGWAGRFLLGSVSQAVAAHAGCPVEIVRRPGANEGEVTASAELGHRGSASEARF